MDNLVLPAIYLLILAALVMTYFALRVLKRIKHETEEQQSDLTTRRGRVVSFLRELPNYNPTGQRQSPSNNASDTEGQRPAPVVLCADSLATYLGPLHLASTDVNGVHNVESTRPKCDLAATYPPPALGTVAPWTGTLGTTVNREFGRSVQSEDSGIFSSGDSHGRPSLESLTTDITYS